MTASISPMPHLLALAPMIFMVAWAAVIDTRTRRIPNWLTASLALAGLVQAMLPGAALPASRAWAGLGAGFALTLILFLAGGMGAGDVKLMAAIGAWVGPVAVFQIFAAAAIIGMLIVVVRAATGRRLGLLVRDSAVLVLNAATSGDLKAPSEVRRPDETGQRRLPYAVPVLGATLAVLAAHAWRWL